MNINRKRSNMIFDQIIRNFPVNKRDFFFGDRKDFFESVSNFRYDQGSETCHVNCQNDFEITYPFELFKKIFISKGRLRINMSATGPIKVGKLVYIPLRELVNFQYTKEIDTKIFPIKTLSRGKTDGFLFLNPTGQKEYPHILDDYFMATMVDTFESTSIDQLDGLTFRFYDFFKPIRYLVVTRRDTRIPAPLEYFLAKDLGLFPEYEDLLEAVKFPIAQSISNIFDESKDQFLLESRNRKTEVLRYYAKALSEQDPLYQFLDFYHIIETYCCDFFLLYVEQEKTRKGAFWVFNDMIRKQIGEEVLFKYTMTFLCDTNPDLVASIKGELSKVRTELDRFIRQINENMTGENIQSYNRWSRGNDFGAVLGRFLFKLRSEIAHRKEGTNPISNYIRNYRHAMSSVVFGMKYISEKIIENEELKEAKVSI